MSFLLFLFWLWKLFPFVIELYLFFFFSASSLFQYVRHGGTSQEKKRNNRESDNISGTVRSSCSALLGDAVIIELHLNLAAKLWSLFRYRSALLSFLGFMQTSHVRSNNSCPCWSGEGEKKKKKVNAVRCSLDFFLFRRTKSSRLCKICPALPFLARQDPFSHGLLPHHSCLFCGLSSPLQLTDALYLLFFFHRVRFSTLSPPLVPVCFFFLPTPSESYCSVEHNYIIVR